MMDILMLTRLWKCQKSKYQLRIYLLSNEHYSQYYNKAHNNFLSPNANQLEMGDNVIKMEMNLFCTPVNVFHVTRVWESERRIKRNRDEKKACEYYFPWEYIDTETLFEFMIKAILVRVLNAISRILKNFPLPI